MQGYLSTNPLVFDELKTEFYYVVKFRRYDILLWKELRSGAREYDTYPFCLQNYIKTLKVIYRINRFFRLS